MHARRPPPALDAAATERLALRYVERYATTRARLVAYLNRKLRERGTAEPSPDVESIVARFSELGYVDDLTFAQMRASAMARRGLGARRVAQALRRAGIDEADAGSVAPQVSASRVETALAFARRKRIGPYADTPADRAERERQIAAMLRAGHEFDLAKRIVALKPGEEPQFRDEYE